MQVARLREQPGYYFQPVRINHQTARLSPKTTMKATLYIPGKIAQSVDLSANTPEAAAELLGVPSAVVFDLSESDAPNVAVYGEGVLYDGTNENPEANAAGDALLGGWCDFHGRILIVQE